MGSTVNCKLGQTRPEKKKYMLEQIPYAVERMKDKILNVKTLILQVC